MPSFLTKVFGRKKDGGDESPGSRSNNGELLDGKFEDVSPTISPSVAHFPELQTNGSPRGRGTERTHSDSRLRTFFRSRSRPASPTRQHSKTDELPTLSLSLFAQDAPAFDDSQLLLTDKAIGERRLTPVEAVGLVKACSQAINNRGIETLGIMNPHWYSASPDVQRRLISLFIHSLTAKSPLTGLPSFTSEINDTRSPHDVAAVLRWGLRHIQLQGNGFGRNEDWYRSFFDEERKAEYPPKAFSQTLAPLIPSEHLELLQEVLEIFSGLAAHAETNSTSGSKLSKVFGLWLLNAHRVESKDDWRSFYERWEVAGRQLEHVFFARIRDEAVENRVPTRLINVVRRYPFYEDTNSPTTDLRLLPRSGLTTRVHDALLVRLETELPSTRFRPKYKVHPLRLIAEALSTAVDDAEYSGLWKKIVDASKTEGTGTPLSRIFSEETIRFLSLLPSDGAGDKSPALSLLPLSPSSPRAKRLSFSLSEFTDEIKRTNSTQSKSTAASPSPLSPLTSDADWSLFATSGFGNSPTLTPLTSALFSTSSDVERTSPPSRKPSAHSKHSASGAPRKSVEFSPAIPSEDSKSSEYPSKIELVQIVQLDEAFIDFWSDTLLDPIAADWPAFVVCKVKSSLVPELKFSPAEGQEKTLQWLVLEQGYTIKAPPPPPVPESATSATAEHTERPSSPQSVGKKRFSFWSPTRTGSFASSIGSTSKKTGKKSSAYERGQRVSEMGEVMEESGSAGGAPLTSTRSAASTIGGGRTRKFRTPAAEDVVRVRIPSPRRKSTDVKSLDATVTSKKSPESPAEGTSAAAAVVAVAAKEEDKAVVQAPVAEKAEETKPVIEEKEKVEEESAAPAEDIPVVATTKEGEVTAVTEEKKPVEEPTPVTETLEAAPADEEKAKAEVEQDTPRALPVEDVPAVVEEVKLPAPETQPAPVVEEKKPVPVEEKIEPVVEEKSEPVVENTAKPAEPTPTAAKEPTNGSVSASEKAKEKEKEKTVTSPEPASVIPKGAVKSLLARFQGKKDKKEKEKAVPSPAPVGKKTDASPPVPAKEEKKVEEASTSAAGSTAAAVVAAGVVAGVAAGVAAVTAKKEEKKEEVVEKAVPAAEADTEPTPVVEETKPAEVREEETKPLEVEEQEPVAVPEPTTEDTPVPEVEEFTAREVPAAEEPVEVAKEEESTPAEETTVAAEAPAEVEVPPAAIEDHVVPIEEPTSAPKEGETVVEATPEAEAEVPAAVVEAVPETVGDKEIDVSPAAAEEASEPTPAVVVEDEEPIEEGKPAAEDVVVEEKETSAPAEETAVTAEEATAPVVPPTEAVAIEEPTAPAVVEEEVTAVPEGAVEAPVDERESPKADVEDNETAVVESTSAPSEAAAEEVPAEVETKEEPTEAEAPEDAPAQDRDVATAVPATIPVVEEPEEKVEALVEPAAETVPVAGEGTESSTEAKEVVDLVEITAAQNVSAPSVSLDTPVLDTQDRSAPEAQAEVEDATKQDQPEATTDPLVESHTVVNPDNQPPPDTDATKEPLADSTSAAEREAEEPQGSETIQETAESGIEVEPTDEDRDAGVDEIKATSPEPHVVPATEEPIIETHTGSGDEIVTVDGGTDEMGQVAEVSEAPIQDDSEVREEPAPVEDDTVETEETHAPQPLSTLDTVAVVSDDADLPANDDTAPKSSDSEAVVSTAKELTPTPEETTVEAGSTLEAEEPTLVSQPQEDVAVQHDEEPANKAAESVPIEGEPASNEPTSEEPVSVPPASTLDATTDSALAAAEDKDDTEGEQHAEDASPAAETDPEAAVIAATVDAEERPDTLVEGAPLERGPSQAEEGTPEQETRVDGEENTALDAPVGDEVIAGDDSKHNRSTEEQQAPTEETTSQVPHEVESVQKDAEAEVEPSQTAHSIALESTLPVDETAPTAEPSPMLQIEEPSLDDEALKQEDPAFIDESDPSGVLSGVPHLEPLNTKDDDPSNELVELPAVPLAEAPVFTTASASLHARVPIADLSDDSPDSHPAHAKHSAVEALPAAIEHTLEVGSTPSAEALLDAVQGHSRAPVEASPASDSSNETAGLQAIPVIHTEDAPDDETKRVPAPLDLRLAETLAGAQDLPSAIEQAAVAGLTPEALLDAVQATLSATVFAPEPAAPTITAQNEDGKDEQTNEAPSIPILNGNGHHHAPDSEAALDAGESKELRSATSAAEEPTQPTETATEYDKPTESTSLAAEELAPLVEVQDAATAIAEEKTATSTPVPPDTTPATEEDTSAQDAHATSEREEKATIAPETASATTDEPVPRQLPEMNDDSNATGEDPQQTVAPDTENPNPAAEAASTVGEQNGTVRTVEEFQPAVHSEASTAEAEETADVVAEKEPSDVDAEVLSPAEEPTHISAEDGGDAPARVGEDKPNAPSEPAPPTTEETLVVSEGKEGDTAVASEKPTVVDEDLPTTLDDRPAMEEAEVATTVVEEPIVEERKGVLATVEPDIAQSETASPTAPEEVSSPGESSSPTMDEKEEEEAIAPVTEEKFSVAEAEREATLKTEDEPLPTAEESIPTIESKDAVALPESGVEEVDVVVQEDAPSVPAVPEENPASVVESETDVADIVSEPEDKVKIEDGPLLPAGKPGESKEVVALLRSEGKVDVAEDVPSIEEEKETSAAVSAPSEAVSDPTPVIEGKDVVVEGEEKVKATAETPEDVASSTAGTNA